MKIASSSGRFLSESVPRYRGITEFLNFQNNKGMALTLPFGRPEAGILVRNKPDALPGIISKLKFTRTTVSVNYLPNKYRCRYLK